MLEARKENKVYQITEQQKDRYLKEGFDIYEDGKVVEYTPLKKISYSKHLNILKEKEDEIADLKEKLDKEETSFPANVLELLNGYAKVKNIDIGSCSTAEGILKKIIEAEK